MKEDVELLVLLFGKKNDVYIWRARPCLPPCHLGPAQLIPSAASVQLNLYDLANRGHNMVYIEQKEGPGHFAVHPDVRQTPEGV
jgi:hypothetical protein